MARKKQTNPISPLTRGKRIKAQQAIERGDLAQARQLYQAICGKDRSDAEAWMTLGALSGQLGDAASAEQAFRHTIRLRPRSPQAHLNLGNALLNLGRPKAAAAALQQSLDLSDRQPNAWLLLGNAQDDLGQPGNARTSYRRALEIAPAFAEAHFNLGKLAHSQDQREQALEHYRRSLELNPDLAQARVQLSNLLADEGRLDEAERILEVAPRPSDPLLLAARANIQDRRGDQRAAFDTLRPLLDSGRVNTQVALSLARLCRGLGNCERIGELLEQVLRSGVPTDQALQMHFAAGKAWDRVGQYARAFGHFEQGNALKGRGFDAHAHRQHVDRLLREPPTPAGPGDDSELPVFIVGMPRSGTSLVEQILASHSRVHGAGELKHMARLAARQDGAVAADLARDYLAQISPLAPDASRITDKMPTNFEHLGLIARLFPRARIIHCSRDPLDTCLSCYMQNFPAGLAFSNHLHDLGCYWLDYRRLMAHWRDTPGINMLEVNYEELLGDQERISRGMLEFLDLEWEPQVLSFHRTQRHVGTASYDQVRQPLYQHARQRWRNYAGELSELKDLLVGGKLDQC